MGRAVFVLDGQNLRHDLNKGLPQDRAGRTENWRRAAHVARQFNEAGLLTLAAFVAPDESVRRKAAERVGADRFLVVHLSAPLAVCRQRDTDGHYALADTGELANFPGISAPYEPPAHADLVIPTHEWPVAKCVAALVQLLESRGVI